MNYAVVNNANKELDAVSLKTIAQSNHLNWLTQVRGVAAIYVLCHHAVRQVIVAGEHAHDPFYRLIQLLTSYGHYAVDVFIVLSGYCLMLPLIKKGVFGSSINFYIRRAVRIILPYYGALALTLILIYFFGTGLQESTWAKHSLPVSFESVWKHLLLIHQWFPHTQNNINGAFWSVGVEFQIYLFFPLFYYAGHKIGFLNTFYMITVVAYALWGITYYFNIFNPSENGVSIYYCVLFFMGVMAARYAHQENKIYPALLLTKYPRVTMLLAVSGIIGLAGLSFIISYINPVLTIPLQIQSFFVGLFVAVLFFLKGCNSIEFTYLNHSATLKCLERVGVLGFSVYLLHDPVVSIVWSYLVLPTQLPFYWLQAVVEIVLGLIISIGVASVFYKYIELPCHQLSKTLAGVFTINPMRFTQ